MKGLLITSKARVIIVMLCLCAAAIPAQAAVEPNNIFDVNTVHSLYIQMDNPADFNTMANSADTEMGNVYPIEISPGVYEHEYWQAYLSDSNSGEPIAVAIRRKSDLALPSELDPQKFSLKIDISRPGFTPEGQRFGGKKKLSLECGSDGSLVSEGIAWNIYEKAEVIASRCNWIKVYMSTDYGASFFYMGLYANVEQPDEEFLEDHMPDRHDYGFLYKLTEYNGDIKKTREDCNDPNISCVNPFEFSWYPFDHPSYMDEDPTPGDWLTQAPQRVDMNQLIRFAAAENFMANADGTVNKGNNFWYYDWATHPNDPYLMDPNYKQPRMYFPWDLDTTMKSSDWEMSITHAQGGHFMEGLILEQDETGTPYGYPTYRSDYLATYRTLLDNSLTVADINAFIDQVETAIAAELDADPYTEVTSSQEFPRLRTFMQDRWDYADGQLDAMAPLAGTMLLDDGFEGTVWDANWAGGHTWVKDTAEQYDGLASAKAASESGSTFTTIDLDASDATAIHLRFWYMMDDTDAAEDFLLSYYNGIGYSSPIDLDTGTDDIWLTYSDTITDSNYFVGDFKVRFDASPESKENVWLDAVEITKETPMLITGTITAGGSPLVGVSVDGTGGAISDVTDANGYYEVEVVYNWSGTVTPTKAGYTFAPVNRAYSNVISDQTAQNYTATLPTYTISGNAGIVGVTMTGLPGAPVTDGAGAYTDTVDYDWSGTVIPTKAGYTFAPVNIVYSNVTADQLNQDYTPTLNTYTISGNAGIAGVTMTGLPGAPVTDGAGDYTDTVDYDWSGTVIPTKAGYTFAPVNIVYSNVTADQLNQDYTPTLNTYTISGNAGIAGVTMTGLPGAPVTDGAGDYTDTVDYDWSGTAVPTKAGYTFSPVNIVYTNVTSDQTAQDYTPTLNTYTISGNAGIVGVTMTGLPGAPVTDGAGAYTDTVDYGWSGTAVPTKAGYTFSPVNIVYTNVTSDQTAQDYTPTLNTYTISGNAGIVGVTMTGLPGAPVTDGAGDYTDTVDYDWSGTVIPTKAGYTFTPVNIVYSNVTSDQLNQDYTPTLNTYTISGNAGIAGVTMTGLPGAPVTDGAGDYTDTVDYDWSGTVIPTKAGYTFAPVNIVYSNVTSDQLNQDYTPTLNTYTISGNAGIAGVTMTGLPGAPVTDGAGDYTDTVDYDWSGTVIPTKAGYTFTPVNIVYSNVTADQLNQDYTPTLNTYTISGNAGIVGVTMTGLPGAPVTDGAGDYTDTVDYDWSGTVIPTKAGYTFTPVNIVYSNVTADQLNQDYTPTLNTYTISGNAGIVGVTMTGLPGAPVTDGAGDYTDTVDYGWSGTVTPTKAGYTFTPVNIVYSNVTSDQLNQDYTPTLNTYTISGNAGIAGVTMTGLPGAPVTDGAGDYTDTVDYDWSGTVIPTKAGYTFTPVNIVYSNVTSDQLNQDYTPTLNTYTISGNAGIAGVTMTGLPGAPVTDGAGDYTDTVDYDWSGTVIPTKAGYTFTPVNIVYSNVTSDQLNQDYTPTLNTYTISGNAGIAGVTMTGLPGAPVTDGAGDYTDTVDYDWSGTVIPTKAGYTFTPVNIVYSNVTSDQLNQDYTPTLNTYTISGNAGIAGVTMTGLPGAPVTDGAGDYTDTVDYDWSGTVIPTKAGYTFTPVNIVYSNVTSDQLNQDYTPTLNTYTISGNAGIAGVTMTGLPGAPVTDGAGDYTDTVDYDWSGTVIPTKAGYTFAPVNIVYTNVTSDQTAQDYTPTLNTYTISGNAGIIGVTMTGLPGAPVTDGAGAYTDTVDYGWSGTVTPTKAGYTFAPVNIVYTNVTSDQTAQDYTPTLNTYTISGNAGIIGVTMTGLPGAPVTDGAGDYTDTVDYGWSGTVTPTKAGYTFAPVNIVYTNVTSDQTAQDYTPTLNTYTISGNAGIIGVTMTGLPGAPVTDGAGDYTDTVDYDWSGTVIPTKAGYTFAPVNIVYSNVTSDQLNQDYTPTLNTYTISGNAGIIGVTMTGLPGAPVTDGAGAYTDTVDYGWSGTVTPTKAGYTFAPVNIVYTNVTSDQLNQDYTPTLNTYTISGNAGIIGVTMTGLPGAPVTDGAGAYTDTVDYDWSGTVIPTKAGYTFAPVNIVYSNVTSDQLNQDYTPTLNTYTISGNAGIAGVTMTGLPGAPVTDGAGDYTDTVDYDWSGTVIPTKAGYTFAPVNIVYSNVTSDQLNQDYTPTLNTYTISGNAGIAGVTMTGLPGAPVTDGAGDYTDTVDYDWSGTVIPTKAGYTFAPVNIVYSNVTSDQLNQDYTPTLNTYTISGNAGIAGVTMTGLPGAPVTDGAGDYTDTVDYDWSGTVIPTKAGYTFTPVNIVYSNVTSDQLNQDYTPTLNTYTISGNAGIDGVTMSGLPGDPVSSGGGNYTAAVSYGWSGTVTPTKAGYTFTPVNTVYTNVTTDQLNQDYTPTLNTYTISGTILVGGSPLAGVTMTGLPGAPVTDGTGFYSDTVGYGFSGTVTPEKDEYNFNPADRVYSSVTSNQTAQDYTATSIYDLDSSGSLGYEDLGIFADAWLSSTGAGNWNAACDFYTNGDIEFKDYAKFGTAWQNK